MKFEVEQVNNGYAVKVGDGEDMYVATTVEGVADIVVTALGGAEKPAKAKTLPKPTLFGKKLRNRGCLLKTRKTARNYIGEYKQETHKQALRLALKTSKMLIIVRFSK